MEMLTDLLDGLSVFPTVPSSDSCAWQPRYVSSEETHGFSSLGHPGLPLLLVEKKSALTRPDQQVFLHAFLIQNQKFLWEISGYHDPINALDRFFDFDNMIPNVHLISSFDNDEHSCTGMSNTLFSLTCRRHTDYNSNTLQCVYSRRRGLP
jgi:hypothetical protein